MANTWFLSDPHFGHKNIIKFEESRQQFKDTEHMDNAIIENYQRTVKPDDIVFWLGDMFFCKTVRMEYIASRLTHGRKILIRGNHDRGHISDTKFRRFGFMPQTMYKWGQYLLTHEPVSEHNMEYLRNQGIRANIHGHVHSSNEHLDPTKYCCVSVELTDYKPINILEIDKRLRDGKAWQAWAERKANNEKKSI